MRVRGARAGQTRMRYTTCGGRGVLMASLRRPMRPVLNRSRAKVRTRVCAAWCQISAQCTRKSLSNFFSDASEHESLRAAQRL